MLSSSPGCTSGQPGDELKLKIVREGKEESQGVGYLDDGTMVVVNDAKSLIGQRKPVVVTGALQTPTGRMVFARLDENDGWEGKESSGPTPPKGSGSNARNRGKASGKRGGKGDQDPANPR